MSCADSDDYAFVMSTREVSGQSSENPSWKRNQHVVVRFGPGVFDWPSRLIQATAPPLKRRESSSHNISVPAQAIPCRHLLHSVQLQQYCCPLPPQDRPDWYRPSVYAEVQIEIQRQSTTISYDCPSARKQKCRETKINNQNKDYWT